MVESLHGPITSACEMARKWPVGSSNDHDKETLSTRNALGAGSGIDHQHKQLHPFESTWRFASVQQPTLIIVN